MGRSPGSSTELVRDGRRPYVIGVGGSGLVGAWGQLLAAREAFSQADVAGLAFDRVVLPSATGGTQAGLIVGALERSAGTAVHGIVVARPPVELRPAIGALVAGLLELAGLPAVPPDIQLDGSQLGEGYGRPTASAADASALLARTEGLLVDPIYTAKALAAVVTSVRAGAWAGERVLFWHAGGLPGIFESLDPLPATAGSGATPRRTATRRGPSCGPPSGGPRRHRPGPRP